MKFWVTMAAYDDSYGVKSTVKHLQLFHKPHLAGIVVVDNNPGSAHGKETARFCAKVARSQSRPWGVKYVAMPDPQGTAPPRNRAVAEAECGPSDFAVNVDSHVDFVPGAFAALAEFLDRHPNTPDLVHGPLLFESEDTAHTHMADEWRAEMWGTWGTAWRHRTGGPAFEYRPDGQGWVQFVDAVTGAALDRCPGTGLPLPGGPFAGTHQRLEAGGWVEAWRTDQTPWLAADGFEIPAMGMGVWATRKDAWLPFHPGCRQFGGEEWTTHVRYREAGRRAWCVPGFQWVHRFGHPKLDGDRGIPYPLTRDAKIKNYVLEIARFKPERARLELERCRKHFTEEIAHPTPPEKFAEIAGECVGCAAKKAALGLSVSPPPPPAVVVSAGSPEALAKAVHSAPTGLGDLANVLRNLAADHADGGPVVDFGPAHVLTATAVAETVDLVVVAERRPGFFPLLEKSPVKPARLAAAFDGRCPLALVTVPAVDDPRAGRAIDAAAAAGDRVLLVAGPGVTKEALAAAVRRAVDADVNLSVLTAAEGERGRLALLSRRAEDHQPLPSFWRMAKNYAGAKLRDAAAGFKRLPMPLVQERWAACVTCPTRAGGRCGACGCPLFGGAGEDGEGKEGLLFFPRESCGRAKRPKLGLPPLWGPVPDERIAAAEADEPRVA